MGEREFAKRLQEELKEKLKKDKDYIVERGGNLLYKVTIDENVQFKPDNPEYPKRSSFAFQTDLLIAKKVIKDNKEVYLPLVVIETKYKSRKNNPPTTHEVLSYSTKAQMHKNIYPYLRYGLVIGGATKIPKRFFIHNLGFDFAYAMNKVEDKASLNDLFKIIKQQINNALIMLNILENNYTIKTFNTILKIWTLENLNKK